MKAVIEISCTVAERFMASFSPEPNTGCWLWTGSYFDTGYGRCTVNGKSRRAHRVSAVLHGVIGGDDNALHACDNRACVNPDHLFAGTLADNNADMMRKGRHRATTGSRNHNSKLTEEQVRSMRALYAAGATQYEVAARFNVSQTVAGDAIAGRQWAHVPGAVQARGDYRVKSAELARAAFAAMGRKPLPKRGKK